jgi:spartin
VPGAAVSLILSAGQRDASVEQFEELLTDYCAFQSDSKGKGTIELMDEKGQLLGTIDGPWHLEEDAAMHKPGFEKDPVLVELPPDGVSSSSSSGTDQKIMISAAPRTEDGVIPSAYHNDWLLKGATLLSKTLVGGSTWAGQKMLDAADAYVAKSTPPLSRQGSNQGSEKAGNEKEPSQLAGDRPLTTSGKPAVTFNPKLHATSQQLKNISGTATAVSGRTRDAVLNVAGKVGDKIGKTTGIQSQPRADGTATKPSGIRGVLNRSLLAANVVLDGLTQSAETLIASGGAASGRAIEHRYGSEVGHSSERDRGVLYRADVAAFNCQAKVISGNTASVGRSAFAVYKDINGVRRKALLKIATGTIKARAVSAEEERHACTLLPP